MKIGTEKTIARRKSCRSRASKFPRSEYSKSAYFISHERYYSASFHVCTGYRRKQFLSLTALTVSASEADGISWSYRPSCQEDLNGRWITGNNFLLSRLSSSEFHNSEKDSNPWWAVTVNNLLVSVMNPIWKEFKTLTRVGLPLWADRPSLPLSRRSSVDFPKVRILQKCLF